MSASIKRRIRRKSLQSSFITDGKERIVDGVRYRIVPLPSAQWDEVSSLLGNAFKPPPLTSRTRKVKEVEIPPPDCSLGCGRSAWHFTSEGNYCRPCFKGE